MIAILVAVTQELRPILNRTRAIQTVLLEHFDFHEGTLADQPVALLALGVGLDCARIAAEVTVRRYQPDLIISAGFGGALSTEVDRGDIVLGTEILELIEDDGVHPRWRTVSMATAPAPLRLPSRLRLHSGKILSAADVLLKAADKVRLGKATGALAVDMETSAVATVCAAHDVPFLAVRCITDNSRDDLPEQFNDFFVIGRLQPRRVAAACARDPHLLLDLARLGYRARVAGRNLAQFLESALRDWPAPARP